MSEDLMDFNGEDIEEVEKEDFYVQCNMCKMMISYSYQTGKPNEGQECGDDAEVCTTLLSSTEMEDEDGDPLPLDFDEERGC